MTDDPKVAESRSGEPPPQDAMSYLVSRGIWFSDPYGPIDQNKFEALRADVEALRSQPATGAMIAAFQRLSTKLDEEIAKGQGSDLLSAGVHLAMSVFAAEVAELTNPAQGWQPIETAPKDGSSVIIYQPDGMWNSKRAARGQMIQSAYWHQPANPARDGFWVPSARPTHWMPLPKSPQAIGGPPAPPQEKPRP